mmetsp:Transcript_50417/g.93232  ORF Transcript_50417/g.93232 Transcript_50417/m.93232 type:complete len:233 (-) Transcript_50417:260-958(-)
MMLHLGSTSASALRPTSPMLFPPRSKCSRLLHQESASARALRPSSPSLFLFRIKLLRRLLLGKTSAKALAPSIPISWPARFKCTKFLHLWKICPKLLKTSSPIAVWLKLRACNSTHLGSTAASLRKASSPAFSKGWTMMCFKVRWQSSMTSANCRAPASRVMAVWSQLRLRNCGLELTKSRQLLSLNALHSVAQRQWDSQSSGSFTLLGTKPAQSSATSSCGLRSSLSVTTW